MLSSSKLYSSDLHLARAVDLETHLAEDAVDLAQRLGLGMQPAGARFAPGQGHIQALAFEGMRHTFLRHLFHVLVESGFERLLDLVGRPAHFGTDLGRQLWQVGQRPA